MVQACTNDSPTVPRGCGPAPTTRRLSHVGARPALWAHRPNQAAIDEVLPGTFGPQHSQLLYVTALLVCYGLAIIPVSYFLAFFFDDPAVAYVSATARRRSLVHLCQRLHIGVFCTWLTRSIRVPRPACVGARLPCYWTTRWCRRLAASRSPLLSTRPHWATALLHLSAPSHVASASVRTGPRGLCVCPPFCPPNGGRWMLQMLWRILSRRCAANRETYLGVLTPAWLGCECSGTTAC
jgi:hypothetical protein